MRILPILVFSALFACSEASESAAPQDTLPDAAIGRADAPVVLIEYASMTCSHCAQFHNLTYPKLKKDYIDTGKVRLIFREYPLDPWATAASMLARCAGRQGGAFNLKRFFTFIGILFQQQTRWVLTEDRMDALRTLARQAGISSKDFTECFENETLLKKLHAGRVRGSQMGVKVTPSFFINDRLIEGNQPYKVFRRAIDEALE